MKNISFCQILTLENCIITHLMSADRWASCWRTRTGPPSASSAGRWSRSSSRRTSQCRVWRRPPGWGWPGWRLWWRRGERRGIYDRKTGLTAHTKHWSAEIFGRQSEQNNHQLRHILLCAGTYHDILEQRKTFAPLDQFVESLVSHSGQEILFEKAFLLLQIS